MKIIIRGCQTYGRNTYSLDVEKLDQISTVKRKISAMDCKHQGLIFNGRQLKEVRSLSDYEIQHESTIHLICRQCGC